MSELRRDPIQKRWVTIAPERNRKPRLVEERISKHADNQPCPFCEGNEHLSNEIRRYESHGRWQVRVVANNYPALSVESQDKYSASGIYDKAGGVGAHEVVIETPDHNSDLPDWNREHSILVWRAYRERLADLENDIRLRHIALFKNHGKLAGASIEHPHGQILASPVMPQSVETRLAAAREYFVRTERCVFCDVIEQELQDGRRILMENESFVAWLPYASRIPFECWVAPRRHQHDFAVSDDSMLADFALFMRDVMLRLRQALGDFDYNLLLHSSPNKKSDDRMREEWRTMKQHYHWHVEILPRMWPLAGSEIGNGFFINPVAPEDAAEFLKDL